MQEPEANNTEATGTGLDSPGAKGGLRVLARIIVRLLFEEPCTDEADAAESENDNGKP